jgi:quercetin dioxygenase-like cupin family protein
MTAAPKTVVVTEELCNACGAPRVNVHHQSFPELRISGESPDRALDELATRLEANLAAVSDPMHRAPVELAIADIQGFINRDTVSEAAVSQAKLSEVIDVLAVGAPGQAAVGAPDQAVAPSMLAKTETLELRRLFLPKGREIPTHQARGEITVHCLKGWIAFTAGETMREVRAGQLIVLAAGEPHSLVALEDSSVLVTKVLLVRGSPS